MLHVVATLQDAVEVPIRKNKKTKKRSKLIYPEAKMRDKQNENM